VCEMKQQEVVSSVANLKHLAYDTVHSENLKVL